MADTVTLEVRLHETEPNTGNSRFGTVDGSQMVRAFLPEFWEEDQRERGSDCEGIVLFREFHEMDCHQFAATKKTLEDLTTALAGISDSAVVRRAAATVEALKWDHDTPHDFDRFVDIMAATGVVPTTWRSK